jgi:hypothetical protein
MDISEILAAKHMVINVAIEVVWLSVPGKAIANGEYSVRRNTPACGKQGEPENETGNNGR